MFLANNTLKHAILMDWNDRFKIVVRETSRNGQAS